MSANENKAQMIKKMYSKGMRVKLIEMKDPYTDLKEGDEGIIEFVDDMGTIFVNWDNGSGLGLVVGEDKFQVLNDLSKNGKRCPKCKKYYVGYPAISRRDNKTEICCNCGMKEAMEDFQNYVKMN